MTTPRGRSPDPAPHPSSHRRQWRSLWRRCVCGHQASCPFGTARNPGDSRTRDDPRTRDNLGTRENDTANRDVGWLAVSAPEPPRADATWRNGRPSHPSPAREFQRRPPDASSHAASAYPPTPGAYPPTDHPSTDELQPHYAFMSRASPQGGHSQRTSAPLAPEPTRLGHLTNEVSADESPSPGADRSASAVRAPFGPDRLRAGADVSRSEEAQPTNWAPREDVQPVRHLFNEEVRPRSRIRPTAVSDADEAQHGTSATGTSRLPPGTARLPPETGRLPPETGRLPPETGRLPPGTGRFSVPAQWSVPRPSTPGHDVGASANARSPTEHRYQHGPTGTAPPLHETAGSGAVPGWAGPTVAFDQIGRAGALTPAQAFRANQGRA
ncbi:hypothetical protein EDD30_5469 [Couchioplanes caeruleus]|uniref:Uncharacterized protein n=1 Tax=Couchioplanes caeruleus TaxID=56438 RepID=A0A3N1GQK5_9ACTN|nr:hypothetical protein EDD30_5469 [Couchioplanes caeruleus]